MTPEELLKPRYKVIADYPESQNEIGNIILLNHAGTPEATELVCRWYDKYPHLFQPLEWWEDRKPGEIEFIKWPDTQMVGKVGLFKHNLFYLEEDKSFPYQFQHAQPATEEEYNNYINSKATQE